MAGNPQFALSPLRLLERTAPSVPEIPQLEKEISHALSALELSPERLRGRRIGVTAGSRGLANLAEIVRALCGWLKAQGAEPFVFPAMGSHGGGTAEGQRAVLEEYGVTADAIGAPIISSMETAVVGTTPLLSGRAWTARDRPAMNRAPWPKATP